MQNISRGFISYLKIFSLSLNVIFLFTSCATTRLISQQVDYENNINKVNYLGSIYSSEINLSNKRIYYCSYINITNDSVNFIDDKDSTHQISINQLEKIRVKDNASSLFSAFWIGLGSGLLVASVSSQINNCGTCHPNIGPLYFGAIAVPVGFMIGYIFTGEKEYIFNNTNK